VVDYNSVTLPRPVKKAFDEMTETILANATLVLPHTSFTGRVHLADGIIQRIETGDLVPAGAIDCAGDLLLPGLIELHTDNLERHIQPRPRVNWPHASAIIAHDAELAGVGITTVFDALRVGSIGSASGTDAGKYARGLASEVLALRDAGALRISHFLHLRAEVCSATLVEEFAEFTAADRVGIVSLMDHTPGQRQFRDMQKYQDYMCGKHGMTLKEFHIHADRKRALRDELGEMHEKTTVAAAARLGAVLASHDDTTEDQVRQSAVYGIKLAEFPTTVEAAEACAAHGIQTIMGAPNLIRGASHSGNVAAGDLAQSGLLDILSSDYIPAALLSGAVRLGQMWNDLPRGIATVTVAPARATGLSDRGRLEVGLRADIIRVQLHGDAPIVRGTWVQGTRVA